MTLEAHSPIGLVSPLIPALFTYVAPERASQLETHIRGLRIATIPGPGFGFAAYSNERLITVAWRGLEYLWVLSYSSWTLLSEFSAGGQLGREFSLAENPATAPSTTLLPWALTNQFGEEDTYLPWPQGTPTPLLWARGSAVPPNDREVATDVCLCATGWILHHELAHLYLNHSGATVASSSDERQADAAATSWLLDQAPAADVRRRAAGIIAALVGLAGLDLFAPAAARRLQTHPHPAD